MTKCKQIILMSLCLLTFVGEAARDREHGENCARRLYEQGTATGARLSRRSFNTVVVGSALLGGYRLYEHFTFETQVRVIYSVEAAQRLTAADLENHLVAATSAYDTFDAEGQHEQFALDNGIEKVPAFRNRKFFGLIPLGTNVTGTLADMIVALRDGEKIDHIKNLRVLQAEAIHRAPELILLKRAFARLEAPHYFAKKFPNEPSAAEMDKNLSHLKVYIFQDEIKLNLDVTLKLKLNQRTNELELVGEAPAVIPQAEKLIASAEALEKLSDSAFRLFYSGLAQEWSAQLTKNNIRNPMADLSDQIAPLFLSNATPSQYDAFIKAYQQADESVFDEGMRKIILKARKARLHITLLAFNDKPHEMEAILKKLLDE